MNQPDFATIRLYSKIRRTLQNMSNDQDANILFPGLFSRLSAVKKDLENIHPQIEKFAVDDPRIYEVEYDSFEEREEMNGLRNSIRWDY